MKICLFSVFVLVTFLVSCNNNSIEGDWIAIVDKHTYSELTFIDNRIEIYVEVAGYIRPREYVIRSDSLISTMGNYKMTWFSKDSLILTNDFETFNLKRVKEGQKLSELNISISRQKYIDDFYGRYYKWKGITPDTTRNKYPEIKEEIIDIGGGGK